MKRLARLKPSPAMGVAMLALFVALGGVGYAASKIGSKQIKNNSILGKDIHNNTVTGKDVKESKLGKVKLAGRVSTLVNFPVKGAPAATDQASAPKVVLGQKGPYQFYGKCFVTPADPAVPRPRQVHAAVFIAVTSGQSIFDTESEDSGILTPTTVEDDRLLLDSAAAPDTVKAGSGDKDFNVTDGVRSYTGVIGLSASKQGAPPSGDAPFGAAGDRCLFGGTVLG
jgi:hypothetical protein